MGEIPEFNENYELDTLLINSMDDNTREAMISYYNDTEQTSGELSDTDFFEFTKSHNVCGPGYYVQSPVWRSNNPDDGTPGWGCQACPDTLPQTQEEYDELGLPEPKPNLSDLQSMCSDDVSTWFPPQYELDVRGDNLSGEPINWTSIAVATDAGVNVLNQDLYRKWFDDRYVLSQSDLNDVYNRSQYDGSLEQFKRDISDTRGSLVPCTTEFPDELNINVPSGFQCSDEDTFGPNHILLDEYEDWRNTQLMDSLVAEPSIQTIGSELLPPNEQFETCMNDLLNEYDDQYDTVIIDEIRAAQLAQDITLLESEHIHFIKRKLQMLLVPRARPGIVACIRTNMFLDASICDLGLTEQMYILLNILFSVIGFHFDLSHVDNNDTRKRDKMIEIIDTLGDLIPRALRQIIDISEEIELAECQAISNKTMILKDLYQRVFVRDTNVVEFSNPFSGLLSDETSSTEFNRTTVLAALAIAFLKYF